MRKTLRAGLVAGALGTMLVLTGCAPSAGDSSPGGHEGHGGNSSDAGGSAHDHSKMDHPADGGPAPEGIQTAANPKYPVGTKVKLAADHMAGMDGATATIVGAFKTYTYSVDYTPVGGGNPVKDHRWVVQEELENPGAQRLSDGSSVTLLAEHMTGMKGAKATIHHSTDETVYMVDYEAGGMKMTNHKWVVESEIRPAA